MKALDKMAHSLYAVAMADHTPWRSPTPLPAEFRTQRLVLRWWRHEDAEGLFNAIEEGRETFLPWLPWTKVDNLNVPQCIFQIERMRRTREATDATPTDFTIGIFDRATGGVVGGTGLHRIATEHHAGEIGYWVRPGLRGAGLCTEATAGMLSWGFLPQSKGGWGLRRIEIRCAGGNLASQRVPRKLGLREEARLVGERWVEGARDIPSAWQDTLVWGVLSEEWDCARHRLRSAQG
jgi:RimJ/RimL family protein N-acetyltransferase